MTLRRASRGKLLKASLADDHARNDNSKHHPQYVKDCGNKRFGLKRRRASIRLVQPIPTIETYAIDIHLIVGWVDAFYTLPIDEIHSINFNPAG